MTLVLRCVEGSLADCIDAVSREERTSDLGVDQKNCASGTLLLSDGGRGRRQGPQRIRAIGQLTVFDNRSFALTDASDVRFRFRFAYLQSSQLLPASEERSDQLRRRNCAIHGERAFRPSPTRWSGSENEVKTDCHRERNKPHKRMQTDRCRLVHARLWLSRIVCGHGQHGCKPA